ncbi:MAG: lysophospholipid acyltransferase family protein [Candidatus Omnitrophica bacterium]|nr:lysophospholipid acyltransferase family protein [Candidatus Omnitrophota bacterium]
MLYLLYRLAGFLALHLPLPLAYFIARRIADWRYYFIPRLRREIKANLKAALKQREQLTGVLTDPRMVRITVRKAYYQFARYLTDFLRSPRLTKAMVQRLVIVENLHYLETALAKKQGVIALTAHVGNWELAGIVTSLLGFPVAAIALPYKSKLVYRFFSRLRETHGVKVILTGSNPKQLLRAIKNNQIIAVLGDRLFGEKGMPVYFLGQLTSLPRGPATLSVRTGAPMLPGFLLMEKNRYKLFFGPVFQPPEGLSDEEKISWLTQAGAKKIEQIILSQPEQWLNFTRIRPEYNGE